MTIGEVISLVDDMKPNAIKQSRKIKWLSSLDTMIKNEILETHEGYETMVFSLPYTESTKLDTLLLVPEPYDEVYRWYLEAQIDLANGEMNKYNNSITLYNNAYSSYANYYNRNVMPIQHNIKFRR